MNAKTHTNTHKRITNKLDFVQRKQKSPSGRANKHVTYVSGSDCEIYWHDRLLLLFSAHQETQTNDSSMKENRSLLKHWILLVHCRLRQPSIHIDGRWSNCLENSTLRKNSEIFRRHCHVANRRLANLARFSSQISSVAKAVRHTFFIAEIFDSATKEVRSKK